MRRYGLESLASHNGIQDTVAQTRQGREEGRYWGSKVPKRVPCMDHLTHTQFVSKDRKGCWKNGPSDEEA